MTDEKQKPAAWHFKCDEYESVTLLKEHADAMVEFYDTTPVPLYYAPTLTDEERAAIEWAAGLSDKRPSGCRTTLRSLLERTK
jgi:hypothetical protein